MNERRLAAHPLATVGPESGTRPVPRDFTMEHDELTPTLKVKRRIVEQRYKETIDAAYAAVLVAPFAGFVHPRLWETIPWLWQII